MARTVTPLVRPEQKSDMTAELAMQRPGALNVSNTICAIFSRFSLELSGDSVIRIWRDTTIVMMIDMYRVYHFNLSLQGHAGLSIAERPDSYRYACFFWLQSELLESLFQKLLKRVKVYDAASDNWVYAIGIHIALWHAHSTQTQGTMSPNYTRKISCVTP